MASTKYIRIQTKGDTEANWLNSSIVPLAREMVYATDTRKIKFGDGEHLWRDLPTYEGSAYTLDENNNANFAGTISSNSKELATKEYVDSKIVDGGGSGDQSEKTVTATYSGTADSDAVYGKIWTSYTAMVKVAEAPKGIKSIKNASISGVRRNNSNLNFTIAVEDSMIDSSNSGLILINYQHLQVERNPIARAAIVTIAGTYNNFAMDGTTDIDIVFTEPGVYLLDNAGYSGQDYTSNFTFTAICDENGTESASPIDYTGNEIQMFNSIICIGDSVTEGTFDIDTAKIPYKTYSYPTNLKKMTGAVVTNAGITGVTSTQWYQAALDSSTYNGHWDQYNEWNRASSYKTAINFKGYDAAIIHLGINDVFAVSDSNPITTVANNFETAINNIITKLREQTNDGIKIFLCTLIPNYVSGSNWEAINEKIRNIVANDTQVYLIDLTKYSKILNDTAYEVDHPTKTGYNELAKEIYALVSYTISQNLSDFNTISTNIINNRQTGADYATKNYVDSKITTSENSNVFKGIIDISNGSTQFYELFSIELTNDFKNAGRVLTECLDFEYNITCNNSKVSDGSFEPDYSLYGIMVNDNVVISGIDDTVDLRYYYTISNGEPVKVTFILSNDSAYGDTIDVEIINKGVNTVVNIPTTAQYTAPTSTVYNVLGKYGITQSQINKIDTLADSYLITMEGQTTDGTTAVELLNNDSDVIVNSGGFLNSNGRLTCPIGTMAKVEITVMGTQYSADGGTINGTNGAYFHMDTFASQINAKRLINKDNVEFIRLPFSTSTPDTIKVLLGIDGVTANALKVTGAAGVNMKWKAQIRISNILRV